MLSRDPNLSNLYIFATGMVNIPKCLYFLMSAEESLLGWVANYWRGKQLFNIVRWELNDTYEWALKIDLEHVDKLGQVAVLPFTWGKKSKPSLLEGIEAWKNQSKGERH